MRYEPRDLYLLSVFYHHPVRLLLLSRFPQRKLEDLERSFLIRLEYVGLTSKLGMTLVSILFCSFCEYYEGQIDISMVDSCRSRDREDSQGFRFFLDANCTQLGLDVLDAYRLAGLKYGREAISIS
jgi:hypothetical protein